MSMTGSYPKVEVLTGPERRRRWSVAEKLEIVAQRRLDPALGRLRTTRSCVHVVEGPGKQIARLGKMMTRQSIGMQTVYRQQNPKSPCNDEADHTLRRMVSCSISRPNARSATSLRSIAFSSSSCFSRQISVCRRPSYFFVQLRYVAWLIPARQQISATGIPSAPCFRMNAFCASENFGSFIVFRSSQPQGTDRKLKLKAIQF